MDAKELKEIGTEAQTLLKSLRDAEEKRLEDLDKKFGTQNELIKEEKARVNQRIDEILESVKQAQADAESALTSINRPGAGIVGGSEVDQKNMAEFQRMVKNGDAGAKEFLEHQKAVDAYLRKGDMTIDELQRKAMSVDSDPDGGYFVMPDTSGRIVQFIHETSPMRQLASVQSISTDSLEGMYDLDEAGSGWTGERGARGGTATPEIGRYRIAVHEQWAEPLVTQKLLDDSAVNLAQWLANKVRRKFSRQEATAFVIGDGVEKPRGFLTYPEGDPGYSSTSAFRKISQRDTGKSGDYKSSANGGADVLLQLVHDLKAEYRNGAVFAMSRPTAALTRTLKNGSGDYVLQMDFTQGITERILGYEMAEMNDMPDPAANSLSVAFGNFAEAYQIVDRVGIRTLRDPFTAKGFVKFYTTRRVGGDVVNFDAIKLLKFAA